MLEKILKPVGSSDWDVWQSRRMTALRGIVSALVTGGAAPLPGRFGASGGSLVTISNSRDAAAAKIRFCWGRGGLRGAGPGLGRGAGSGSGQVHAGHLPHGLTSSKTLWDPGFYFFAPL